MAKEDIERMRHEQARIMYSRFLSEAAGVDKPGQVRDIFVAIVEDALKDRDVAYGAMLRPPRRAKPA